MEKSTPFAVLSEVKTAPLKFAYSSFDPLKETPSTLSIASVASLKLALVSVAFEKSLFAKFAPSNIASVRFAFVNVDFPFAFVKLLSLSFVPVKLEFTVVP